MWLCVSGEAVYARCLSSLKDERVEASKHLQGPSTTRYQGDAKEFVEHVRKVPSNSPIQCLVSVLRKNIMITCYCLPSGVE